MKVTVVGAGKMGLPLACQFATRGATVTACDVNEAVVAAINAGRCGIDEPGIPEMLSAAVAAGRLRASTQTAAAVAESEVVVVIVPVVLTEDREAELTAICGATRQIAGALRRGTMVCYETTLPVGTTRGLLAGLLESGSGLRAGVDFDLVFSPERVKSQRVLLHLTKNPKVVGGCTPAAAARGADFYGQYLGAPVLNVGTLEAAELVKLAGMVYRDVNIALANELATYAEAVGVDLGPVLEAANTDGEAHLLTPGLGVGGHCTPVYPYFLTRHAQRIGVPAVLTERARHINDRQVSRLLDRVERTSGPLAGKKTLILGLAFRPEVKEHICSPAFLVRAELERRGAVVRLHDPLYSDEEIRGHGFEPGALEDGAEVVILNTAHRMYARLDLAALARGGARVVLDGRNLWSAEAVIAAGLEYVGVGRPAGPSAGKAARRASRRMIPISRPVLGGEESEAAAETIRSGWVGQGPQVGAFEKEFAAYVGAEHACAVSSCTAALHLALLAVGVGRGDEVLTVSHSFIATANAIRYCGAQPVFVDIDPRTYNMDVKLLERAITHRTKAILAVHQMGLPCELGEVLEIARRHGLPVVEDAACALGSEIRLADRWERIGRPHGMIACFSFHPRKIITTGEGGMITTADAEMDQRMRQLRQHAMDVSDVTRHGSKQILFERYGEVGFNYRLSDVQAAMGRVQLQRLPGMLGQRRILAARYGEALAEVPGLKVPQVPAWARTNWQSYPVRVGEAFGLTRDEVMQRLLDQGISTRRGIMNAHQEPAYGGKSQEALRESEQARDSVLLLPLFDALGEQEQQYVIEELRRLCGQRK